MLEGDKQRQRAIELRRLAAGADDPQFTLKLKVLAEEYDAKAIKTNATSFPLKT